MSIASTLPGQPEPLSMGQVLRIPVMRRLWIAQIVSVFGDFLAVFAVINFLTFHAHASPQQVTGLQIAYLLPVAILGILAGVFVDRWPLKPVLVTSDLLRCGLCLLLLAASGLWHFYLILAAISVVSSFFGPAQGVAIRSAVPLHGLRSANALMQQVMFAMRIIGPGLAGLVYKLLGPRVCYIGDSASFLASGLLIASLVLSRSAVAPAQPELETTLDAALPPTPESAPVEPPRTGLASILPDMKQGLSFIVHHSAVLFIILALAAAMFIIGCFGPLIAVYVRDSVRASTGIYATASAAIGLGMLAGVNLLNSTAKRVPAATLVYTGLIGIGAGLLILAGLAQVWSTVLADLIIGVAVAAIVVPANTLIQQETPAALMGRVGSTSMSLVFTAQVVGLALSGQLADRIGVRHVFAVCAALLVAFTLAGRLFLHPHPAE